MKRLLPIIVLIFGLFALWQAGDALAACYCVNPGDDGCVCQTSAADAGATHVAPDPPGGIPIACDNEYEARSVFVNNNAICGDQFWVEIIPSCSMTDEGNGPGSNRIVCWGTGFVRGDTRNIPNHTGGTYMPWNQSVDFNGYHQDNANFILTCHKNNYCCTQKNCTEALPEPTNCKNQDPSALTSENFAMCSAGGNLPAEIGEGESRLWFSQTRLIAALASAAQTLFNPFGLDGTPDDGNYNMASFSKNTSLSDTDGSVTTQGGLTSRVEKHQGINDSTRVVNSQSDSDNNSSVIVGEPAPPNLYQLPEDGDDNNPYNNDRACYIEETKDRAGDDLVGPRIVGELLYTGEFIYRPYPKTPGCVGDGEGYPAVIGAPCNCCSKKCSRSAIVGGVFEQVSCGTIAPFELETKGDIQIFDKTPLIEHIYNVLLAGSDSLYKRFMPLLVGEFEEIPTSTGFKVSVDLKTESSSPVEEEYAEGQADSPRLYIPRVGTLDKYWLDEFQKSIRPQGYGRKAGPAEPPTAPTGNAIVCSYSQDQVDNAILAAEQKYGLPTGLLQAILEIEGTEWIRHQDNYICKENYAGAAGIMQVMRSPETGIDTYTYATCSNERMSEAEEFGSCTSSGGRLSRCDVDDVFELAARTLMWKAGLWDVATCSETNKFPAGPTNKTEIYEASCKYYGNFKNIKWPFGYLATLPNPLRPLCSGTEDVCMNYCDVVCNKMGICPDYPPQYPQ